MKTRMKEQMTVAELRREIHLYRKAASKAARERDLVQWEVDRNRHWLPTYGLLKPEVARLTRLIQRALTAALHLEARLPENNEPEARAQDWWDNLRRLAAEAERELAVQAASPHRPASPVEPRPVGRLYWYRALARDAATGQVTPRYYQVRHPSKMQLAAKGWRKDIEMVSCEAITEQEYLAGKQEWLAQRSN
jgi:hypothetical protein